MATIIRASILASAVLISFAGGAKAADSDTVTPTDDTNTCSAATLDGIYGFASQGTHAQGRKQMPYYAVRTATFDGTGKTSGKGMANVNGKILSYSVDGTYTVNADCSMTIDATQTFGGGKAEPYKQFGVLVDGGDEIMVMQTTGGRNQAGRYVRY